MRPKKGELNLEKWIHRISFIITLCIMYVIAGFSYLSFKGFVYQNGTFELVKSAQAGLFNFNADKEKTNSAVIAKNVALNLPQTVIVGSPDAPLTIFEFSSLSCMHCADVHLTGIKKLEKDFLDTGKVRIIFIHFPLDRHAMQAAMLAECVSKDKRADFLNLVFKKQREWILSTEAEKHLINYAMMNGLTQNEAEKCLKNDDLAKEIISYRQEAIDKLKIEGTPAFLVSTKNKNEIIYGISNIIDFKAYLNERLADNQ